MENRFNEAIYDVLTLGEKYGEDVKEIHVMLELGKLYYLLEKTIDTYKRISIKEQIKKIEGDGE